ncbi:MAG: glycosyltransferase, partial [Terriglobia bacterium]
MSSFRQKRDETVSVVIPVRNMAAQLRECLESLNKAHPRPKEIIVVDDCSQDNSAQVARKLGARTITLDRVQGANYCRNIGAAKARSSLLLFLDSDVVPERDIVERVTKRFTDSSLQAIVGVYAARHRHENLASRYKNFWIRYSYLNRGSSIDWIFGAVSAIRKNAFQHHGGFDGTLFMQNSGGDLELGKRMAHAYFKIEFAREVEVEHQKYHTVRSLLHNDFERSRSLVEMALKLKQLTRSVRRGFVNIYTAFVVGTLLSLPMLLSAGLSLYLQESGRLFFALTVSYGLVAAPFVSSFVRLY